MKEQKKPPYGIIAILFTGAFVAIFNQTLLNIALPSIMIDFGIEASTAQWLVTAYMLVNGILIPASAYLIQRYSNRSIFIVAMSLFALGTLMAATAPVFSVLLAGRMVQAAGAALMMPLLMNVMLAAFPIEKRGSAMGFFGLVMVVAPAIGPTLSGFIVEHYSWRVLFWIVLPVALIPLALGIFKLKNLTFQDRNISLDTGSLILSTLGFGGILYGFSSAGTMGWTDPTVMATIAVGIISLVIFVFRQLKLDEPLLQIRIYKYPMFALSSAISVVVSMSMFSAMILMPIYIQTIKGISPIESGLLMLPGALVMGAMSPITGRLFDRFGAKVLAIPGLAIVVLTTYMFSQLSLDSSFLNIMLIYTLRMFGISMVMMPVMTNGLNTLPMKSYPHGTAINNTLQQVAGAVGSAFLISIMNARTETAAKDLAASGTNPADILNLAMLDGINFSFFVSTFIALVALALALFIKKPVRPATEAEKEIVYKQKEVTE
ncbi:MFS transporter [Planococcus glaciei]|uniref:MDR family MFS transporter n=1 Tax=Planococcus glaciei TaxID=459472 RepID=UPI00069FD7FC|nr:MDR family MFS transporter [Planococcus glaciei]KOF09667.1 MFS transporter [Planococcus glaciei]MBX0316717.1 DHA2 family efflux MFS transporter permease subunit [Planococcus glaciei]MCP2036643.1 EmrB/QacA subfamily drug resistance transporter [Planomicrobium sp. HSC-17F08]SDI57171.1 drug resistance transporter, EmrB/QacA subfamily [Planococcus glaciei]